jgi:hypothetical protein
VLVEEQAHGSSDRNGGGTSFTLGGVRQARFDVVKHKLREFGQKGVF